MSTTDSTTGQIRFQWYDDYIRWIFDWQFVMEAFRFTFSLGFLVLLPLAGYGAYIWYW